MKPRLQLLGPPSLFIGERLHVLSMERRTQLLAWLALERRWVGRAEVAALMWPGQESKLAYTNLRKTLFRMDALPYGAALEQQGGALRFDADTDVQDFDTALAQQRLDDALALHRGELLQGWNDDANEAWTQWLVFARQRLRSAWRTAALQRLEGGPDARFDAVAAIALSARLLEADPLDEAAMRAHLRALADGGQAVRAQQVWQDFRTRLADELGVEPSAALSTEIGALRDRVARGVGEAAAAVSRPGARGGAPPDGFIGRSIELRRIAELIGSGCRLLTIVGPGGAGKTSLARRAASSLAPQFADGVTWLALEDLTLADDVGTRLAQALGLRLAGGRLLDQLVDALREQQRLLVLDNVEQLAAQARQLEPLLAGCLGLVVIVTSRVRLALADEQLLPLAGLPCPEPEDAEELEAFDAARLFLQAARRVEPALVSSAEAAGIIQICRQVDGLPLALELAAAWTRVLSCDAIAAELQRGVELLRSADPTRPPRQASIEAVFEQSWRLLGERERGALARLAVFRGGFTAEAARAVAAAPPPLLAALADRSLLRREGSRHQLHPLLLQLAAERLDPPALVESTARAHGQHFLHWLAQMQTPLHLARREALNAIEDDFDNVRAAWRWAVQTAAAEALARTAPALMDYCDHRGRWTEGLALFDEAMEALAGRLDTSSAAALQGHAAHLAHRLDRYDRSDELAQQAWHNAGDDGKCRQQAAKVLGANAIRLGRLEEAERWYQQVIALANQGADRGNGAAALSNLSLIARDLGRPEQALDLALRALQEHRAMDNAAAEALNLNNLALLQLHRGDLAAARVSLRAGAELCRRQGLPTTASLIENNLADLAWREGDMAAATVHGQRAIALAEAAGQRAVTVLTRLVLVRVALHAGDLATARDELAAAMQIALVIGRPALKANGAYIFPELLAARGELLAACRVLAFAMRHPTINDADRREGRARLLHWGWRGETEPDWPGLDLDELVRRIAAEREVGHAPLIALLRG